MTGFSSEALLHRSLLRAIRSGELPDLIVDDAGLAAAADRVGPNQLPVLSIDHISRLAALKAGHRVLQVLGNLEVLSSDRNVSITTGEVLRPDIVCINPEEQSVVLFELKKAGDTGRQALTELLAYEQEIKNLLPFLGNYDVYFVLVSTEWTPLMDHAAAAAIAWSGKQILCLQASRSGRKLQLKTRVPSAWRGTASVYFPEQALPCVTLCLYGKDIYSEAAQEAHARGEKDETLDPRILTALQVIAREGDRLGGHGFAVLWKDRSSLSLTSYNLTVCGVAPFAFYASSRARDVIAKADGRLVASLDRYIRDCDPQGHSASLMAAAKSAMPLLREVCDPTFEGFSNWNVDSIALRSRAQPLLCEFWGILGDFARAYVLHPAVRTHRRMALKDGLADWQHPDVGIPIVRGFTRPDIFRDGEVRCSDAFELGALLGLDRFCRANLKDPDHAANAPLRCEFEWNRVDLLMALDEMRLLANAAENVTSPAEPLRFHSDPLADDDEDFMTLSSWITKEFLQESDLHAAFLTLGFVGAPLFKLEMARNDFESPPPPAWLESVEPYMRFLVGNVLARCRQLEKDGGADEEFRHNHSALLSLLGLRRNFAPDKLASVSVEALLSAWRVCLMCADHVLPTVFHRQSELAPAHVDWAWFQQGVAEMRARGVTDAGVILLPNGQFVTGRMPPGASAIMSNMNPEEQVPFLDNSHGFGLLRLETWARLRDGSAFRRAPKPGTDTGSRPDERREPETEPA